ncbi:hypothetical protein GW17_00037794 [Ensete ventricosum]|nr:hypothetical protein GW17_00037794 [Ensete ventricosum]
MQWKDLFWYARDKKSDGAESDAIKEEIRRVKEEEEQAMREALGLAPKRASRSQGNRLDKHEYAELIKRGSTAEDLGAGHAEAAQVQGLGLYKLPGNRPESSSQPDHLKEIAPGKDDDAPTVASDAEPYEGDLRKKRRHEERRDEVKMMCEERRDEKRRREKHEKKRYHDSSEKQKHRHREKGKRRHDSN